jgi:uncharacterized membrane protein
MTQPPTPPSAPPPPYTPPPAPPPPAGNQDSNRTLMLILSYIPIANFLPLLIEQPDPEVRWHAKHGTVIFVAEVILAIVFTIISTILSAVTLGLAGCLMAILSIGVLIGLLALHIVCILKALKGERFLIPVVSDFVNRF